MLSEEKTQTTENKKLFLARSSLKFDTGTKKSFKPFSSSVWSNCPADSSIFFCPIQIEGGDYFFFSFFYTEGCSRMKGCVGWRLLNIPQESTEDKRRSSVIREVRKAQNNEWLSFSVTEAFCQFWTFCRMLMKICKDFLILAWPFHE